MQPDFELIVSGYSSRHRKPEIRKVALSKDGVSDKSTYGRGEYGLIFGGQFDVIDRLVRGMDYRSRANYIMHMLTMLTAYRDRVQSLLDERGLECTLPDPSEMDEELGLTDMTWLSGLDADLMNFSEQAAIDLVDFLIDVMIKSQQFSTRLPTVGGNVHVALITKSSGFRWISREEYTYRNHSIPKYLSERP